MVSCRCARWWPAATVEQMEVVIAEHRDGGVTQRLDLAQHGERIGTAVDEVADEPQPIRARREADQLQQPAEFGVAALDVTDRVEAHDYGMRGAAMRGTMPRRAHERPARIRDGF